MKRMMSMRTRGVRILSFGTAWLLSLLLLSAAAAPPCTPMVCRCVPISQEEAAQQADGIFTATVVSVRPLVADSGAPPLGHEVRMRVHAAWKGVDAAEVVVAGGMTSCDFDFKAGDRYLIYGSADSGGAFHAGYCSGSRRVEPGDERTDALGPPARTWPDADPPRPR